MGKKNLNILNAFYINFQHFVCRHQKQSTVFYYCTDFVITTPDLSEEKCETFSGIIFCLLIFLTFNTLLFLLSSKSMRCLCGCPFFTPWHRMSPQIPLKDSIVHPSVNWWASQVERKEGGKKDGDCRETDQNHVSQFPFASGRRTYLDDSHLEQCDKYVISHGYSVPLPAVHKKKNHKNSAICFLCVSHIFCHTSACKSFAFHTISCSKKRYNESYIWMISS